MRRISQIKIAVALAGFILFFAVTPVFAAEVRIDSKSQEIKAGEQFETGIFLNTQEEYINAVDGKIVFPSDLLELKEIRDGGSIINFWIEQPKVTRAGIVDFSGIIPGGYRAEKGLLFSVVFRAKTSGDGVIEIQGANVLLHDGNGTPTSVKIFPFPFSISQKGPSVQPTVEPVQDSESPEEFRPEIAQNPDLFQGQGFLVFATQDKGSGVERYEVCEGNKTTCVTAESPHLLQNQKLNRKIFVKAVDDKGNERIEIVYPPNWRPWYKKYWIFGILLVGALLGAFIVRKILRRKNYTEIR